MTLVAAPGSEHTVLHMAETGKETIGTVSIPMIGQMPAASATSLRMLDLRSWLPADRAIEINIISGSSVLTLARNEAVQKMRGDWLIFIDKDMVYDPDAVKRLVQVREEHDLDMVGGLCFRRDEPYQPTLYMRESQTAGAYNFLEDWQDDLIEVDATGMAFMLIHQRVFEKIAGSPMPSYAERQQMGPSQFFRWQGIKGEDLRFCEDARAAGCRIWIDTRIEIGHVTEKVVGKRDFLTQMAFRSDELIAERRMLNDRMGLPTKGRDSALAELGLER